MSDVRQRRRGRWGGLLAWAAGCVLWLAAAAAAQDTGEDNQVRKLPTKNPAAAMAVAAVMVAGTLVIAFKNAKRTHLD